MGNLLIELEELDALIYETLTGTRSPQLDRAMFLLTKAADHGKLWFGAAAVLALPGGQRGRRAARRGVLSLALASGLANLVGKPLAPRRRPVRRVAAAPHPHLVRMPRSSSFPSGHTASAFAFAAGAGAEAPSLASPLLTLAALVGYSRVHTGVHYPADVVAGALVGLGAAKLAGRLLE